MSIKQRAVVANTDQHWFAHFRPTDHRTHYDEVDFWRPRATQHFRSLSVGEPFFFRLKHPINAIAGYGFFVVQAFLTISLAWRVFGERNGDPTFERFVARISRYRGQGGTASSSLERETLNCLILPEATFLPKSDWIPWGAEQDWARNIVAFKTVDLKTEPGRALLELLRAARVPDVADLAPEFVPL